MRRLLLWLLTLLVACSTNPGTSPGLLWKITTADGKTSHLFGTMHLYPQDRISISKQTLVALENAKVLATERNVQDAEDHRLFVSRDQHKLGARTYQIIKVYHGGRLKSMEGELMRIADRHRIPVTGLETAQEVLQILDQIPLPLDENLSEEEIIAQHELLIELYNSGKIDSLADVVLNQELGIQTRKLMVDQRNLNWLDDMETLLQPGGAFIAVGLAHLGGENGLVQLLRKRGYRVESVVN